MTEDIRARAIRGDVRTIAGLLSALSAPTAARSQWHIAAAALTPGGLWALLDTAEAHRPRTDHAQESEFAHALRRLARDYEYLPSVHEAMVKWAMIRIMVRRVATGPQAEDVPAQA